MKLNNTFTPSRKDLIKGLKLPDSMSLELAEIIGIHFGDGCMTHHKTTHRIMYSINSRDASYADYIHSLFLKVFNISMKRIEYPHKNEIELYYMSKNLCLFFNNVLLVPFSPKINLKIPEYIRTNPEYIICFIRGLFDTDGCFTIQRDGKYSYNMIKICTGSKSFAIEIDSALKSLGIQSYICRKKMGFDVVIKRITSYERFVSLIKPKNTRGNRSGDGGIRTLISRSGGGCSSQVILRPL